MLGALIDRPLSNERASVLFDEITEVENFESFFSASEEVNGVEHLFAEPGCKSDMFDSILGFNIVDPQKCFDFKDFTCDMEYNGIKLGGGSQDSILAQGDNKKVEFVDGLLQVTDEGVLHATNIIPALCEDNFLITALSDEGSTGDDGPSQGYCLKHLGKESQCPSSHVNDSVAISELCAVTMPMLESTHSQNYFLGLETIDCDSLEISSAEIKSERQGLQDSEENEGPLIINNRRLRKPNLRYVEESMEQQPKRLKNITELSNKSWDKFMHLKPDKKPCREGNRGTQLIGVDESFREAIRVPFSIPIHKRQSKKRTPFQKHESEEFKDCKHSVSDENNDMRSFLDEPQGEMSEDDDCIEMHRKKNKYWTTSEMMKLTEGVSQYGVGKWSKIKSHLFSSASHRTSIDLKDKWRNLMRAAGRRVHSNSKVKPEKKHPPRQMRSILRRVKELAALPSHHPKQCKFEDLTAAPIAPCTPASTCEKQMRLSTSVKG